LLKPAAKRPGGLPGSKVHFETRNDHDIHRPGAIVTGLPGAGRSTSARGTRSTFKVGDKSYTYFSLAKAAAKLGNVDKLRFS
jgi:hypothetical protein